MLIETTPITTRHTESHRTMPKTTTVAEYLSKAMDLSGKSQREIAREVGYPRPNIMSMMRLGQSKVPIERVPDIAKATGVDPATFMRIALQEYMPVVWETMKDLFGEPITAREKRWLDILRDFDPDGDLPIDTTMSVLVTDALKASTQRA